MIGAQYDGDGNLNDWWSSGTSKAFKKRTQCIEQQYGNYTVDGDNVNGKLTLGENIADNGGLKAAFDGYQTWVQAQEQQKQLHPSWMKNKGRLPGLQELSAQHLFFLSFASVW